MNKKLLVSKQTRDNWLVDGILFSSGILAVLSGVYFLFLPQGGYRGGRNPLVSVTIFFDRHTWDDLHTWSGVAMIAIAAAHVVIHWKWITSMVRRILKELTGRCGCLNSRGRWNLLLNLLVAISFVLTALSGIYFLFFPDGRGVADPMIGFSRLTWDLIHTWAGVVLIISTVTHFAIHWRWVVNVTGKMVKSLFTVNQPRPVSHSPEALNR